MEFISDHAGILLAIWIMGASAVLFDFLRTPDDSDNG